MKTINQPFAVLLCFAAGLSCNSRVDVERESARLLQTDVEFSRASLELRAAEAFKLFLTEDAIQLPSQADPIVGGEEIYQTMLASGRKYTLQWEPKKAEVAGSGDIGYTWGTYTVSWQDEERKPSYGKYVNVWRKQSDGSWKVIIDIGNQSPPPPSN